MRLRGDVALGFAFALRGWKFLGSLEKVYPRTNDVASSWIC